MARFLYALIGIMRAQHRNLLITLPLAIGALMLTAAPSAFAAHEDGQAAGHGEDARTTQEPPARSRLRFRDGPVCMCSQGMSEEDIQRARDERRDTASRWRRD